MALEGGAVGFRSCGGEGFGRWSGGVGAGLLSDPAGEQPARPQSLTAEGAENLLGRGKPSAFPEPLQILRMRTARDAQGVEAAEQQDYGDAVDAGVCS